MNILSIDTAGLRLHETSVTIKTEKGTFTKCYTFAMRQQEEVLLLMIDSLVREAGISKQDIHVVLVAEGPGSFTGLRIAYSTAKALALAINATLVPIPTLACLQHTMLPYDGELLVAIDAKRDAVYGQVFCNSQPISEPFDKPLIDCVSNMRSHIVCLYAGDTKKLKEKDKKGDLTNLTREKKMILIEYTAVFSIDMLAFFLAYQKNIVLKSVDDYVAPMYIRKSDAEQ